MVVGAGSAAAAGGLRRGWCVFSETSWPAAVVGGVWGLGSQPSALGLPACRSKGGSMDGRVKCGWLRGLGIEGAGGQQDDARACWASDRRPLPVSRAPLLSRSSRSYSQDDVPISFVRATFLSIDPIDRFMQQWRPRPQGARTTYTFMLHVLPTLQHPHRCQSLPMYSFLSPFPTYTSHQTTVLAST